MKKSDIILGISILAVSIILFSLRFFFQEEGASVVVEIGGEPFGTYSLDKEQEVDIEEGNRLLIEDHSARMSFADCPDHLCVRQGRIRADGEMIICLPNRVTVRISDKSASGDGDQPDVIAN
ncbi:MAG: NusG domain II-containing protein [Lachnospiraceae bacterium]|nr:NusG domain II-containing protein [Lachnospiraceae bacterium]